MKMISKPSSIVPMVLLLSCGCNQGGMRSDYPARDNDPKLLAFAQSAVLVINGIESYEKRSGKLPEKLEDAGITSSDVYYSPGSNQYTLTIKLGWDPSLIYSSRDRSWTFDPGDGTPEKKIKLDAEQSSAPLPSTPQTGPSEGVR